MTITNNSYDFIMKKINTLRASYTSLRTKPDPYAFSALCIKANLYKNPALILTEQDLEEIIVGGQYDGGVDVMLTDPNSESADLIIGQSKFYTFITG